MLVWALLVALFCFSSVFVAQRRGWRRVFNVVSLAVAAFYAFVSSCDSDVEQGAVHTELIFMICEQSYSTNAIPQALVFDQHRSCRAVSMA